MTFLKAWLVNHIQKSDKEYTAFCYPMAQNNPKSMIFERLNAICIKVAAKRLAIVMGKGIIPST